MHKVYCNFPEICKHLIFLLRRVLLDLVKSLCLIDRWNLSVQLESSGKKTKYFHGYHWFYCCLYRSVWLLIPSLTTEVVSEKHLKHFVWEKINYKIKNDLCERSLRSLNLFVTGFLSFDKAKIKKKTYFCAQVFISFMVNLREKDWKFCAQGKVSYEIKDYFCVEAIVFTCSF